ncbi:MAG: hypothetical protein AAGD35_13330 [Actinomycetota bacterium]
MGRKNALVLVVGALVAAGCSFSIGDTPASVAEGLIEGELAEQIGLNDVTAECEVPPNSDAGTTFTCTSTSDRGEVRYVATMEDDDTVFVAPDNVMDAGDIDQLEAFALGLLAEEFDITFGDDDMTCGPAPLVIPADRALLCDVVEPASGDVYEATVTFTSDDYDNVDISIADEPKG